MTFNSIIERMKEPSTFASLGALFLLLGVSVEQFNEYVLAISGIFAFIGVFLKEKSSTDAFKKAFEEAGEQLHEEFEK